MIPHAQRYTSSIRQANWVALTTLLFLSSPAVASESWSVLIDPDNSLSFNFLRDDRPVFHLGLGGWGPKWAWVGMQARQKAEDGRLSLRRPLRREQGQGRGDRRPLRGLAAGRPAGGLPLRPGVGPGRAAHHADRRRQLRAARQPGDAHPDPRRGQADQDRAAHARHPLRAGHVAGRLRLRQGRHGHDAARSPVPHRVRQRHARGAGVRPVPPRASAA